MYEHLMVNAKPNVRAEHVITPHVENVRKNLSAINQQMNFIVNKLLGRKIDMRKTKSIKKIFTKIPHIVPFVNKWEPDPDHELVDNLYCPNCFSSEHLLLLKRDFDKPFNERTFLCGKCGNFDFCNELLEDLPSNWEIEQQKAMQRKRIDDEMDELQDEMDDLESEKKKWE